jgi:hypothetical protein
MIHENIKLTFNNTDPANFNKLDKSFLKLIFGFFKSEKIVEVSINSTFRKVSATDKSFHAFGQALDLHSVKYSSGKIIYFNRRDGKSWKASDDAKFADSFNDYFKNYRIEYFSPARMISVYNYKNNIYLNSKQAIITQKLLEKSQGKKIDLDAGHLDHLHLAIAPNKLAKPRAIVKSILPAVAMIFFFMRF